MLKHTTDKTAAATRDFITPIVNGWCVTCKNLDERTRAACRAVAARRRVVSVILGADPGSLGFGASGSAGSPNMIRD